MDIEAVDSDTSSGIIWNYDAETESEHDWRGTETERTKIALNKYYVGGKRPAGETNKNSQTVPTRWNNNNNKINRGTGGDK